MRQQILQASVTRHLPPGVRLVEAVVMWRRHHLMVPFAAAVAVVVAAGAAFVGFGPPSAVALGVAAGAIGASATTEHLVLASTTDGLHLLRASRVRRAAVRHLERLSDSTPIELVGNQFVITEWQVGDHRFTVPKSSESAMIRIAASSTAG
jgi:hypothetical protein